VKDDNLYLRHILDAIERITSYTSAGGGSFRQDLKTQDAVIRNLQVIGEAAKKVSGPTRVPSHRPMERHRGHARPRRPRLLRHLP
jgi:uncharacterized protein with HEPN domain